MLCLFARSQTRALGVSLNTATSCIGSEADTLPDASGRSFLLTTSRTVYVAPALAPTSAHVALTAIVVLHLLMSPTTMASPDSCHDQTKRPGTKRKSGAFQMIW